MEIKKSCGTIITTTGLHDDRLTNLKFPNVKKRFSSPKRANVLGRSTNITDRQFWQWTDSLNHLWDTVSHHRLSSLPIKFIWILHLPLFESTSVWESSRMRILRSTWFCVSLIWGLPGFLFLFWPLEEKALKDEDWLQVNYRVYRCQY